jgi:GntR family transcriptional regulator
MNQDLPIPLYHQIYIILRDKIVNGVYAHGSRCPSENAIVKEFDVSRITARRALNNLADEGLVRRKRGVGTIVTYKARQGPNAAGMDGLLETMQTIVRETRVELLDADIVPADYTVAQQLAINAGENVRRIERVRSKDKDAFSHVVAFVPMSTEIPMTRAALTKGPLLGLIENSGARISRAQQTITATLADARLARLLRTSAGAPLISVSRTVFDTNERPVLYLRIMYRADRHQIRENLTRENSSEQTKFWKTFN